MRRLYSSATGSEGLDVRTMATNYKIAVVGLGLVGGALAALISDQLPDVSIVGVEPNQQHVEVLISRGLAIDRRSAHTDLADCDYVFVATPPRTVSKVVREILSATTSKTTIIDMASTKSRIVTEVCELGGASARFVGGHPLAGGNTVGPIKASGETLYGATFVLTPHAFNTDDVLEDAANLLENLSFKVSSLPANDHDKLVAITSHLPHLISYTYASVLLHECGRDETHRRSILDFTSRSTKRMAEFASPNSEMWSDIFSENLDMVAPAIDKFIVSLLEFRARLRKDDLESLSSHLSAAAQITEMLNTNED